MAPINLNDVRFDLNKISIREYRKFSQGTLMDEADDEILERVTGLSLESIRDLSQMDYRRLLKGFFDAAREPLADPN